MGLIFLRTHFPTWIPRASGLGQISDTHSNFPLQILNLINSTPHLSWTWGCFKYSISLSSYPQLNFIFFNSPLPFNQLSSQENKTQKKKGFTIHSHKEFAAFSPKSPEFLPFRADLGVPNSCSFNYINKIEG